MNIEESIDNFRFYFNHAAPTFLLVSGVICNAIVIFIFLSKKLRDISMNRYLVAQAISDTIIVSLLFPYAVPKLYEITIWSCKTIWYTIGCFYTFSAQMCTLAAIDRYFCVRYSLKFQFRKKTSFQVIILLAVLVLGITTSLPYSLYYDVIIDENNQTICVPTSPEIMFYTDISLCCLNAVIPFIIMVFCSISVYRGLIHLRVKLCKSEAKKETNLLKTLIGISVFFFIINAPVNVALVFSDYNSMSGPPSKVILLIYDLTGAFSTLHSSFSIGVYLISNKMFRGQFFRFFCCRKISQAYVSSTGAANTKSLPWQTKLSRHK